MKNIPAAEFQKVNQSEEVVLSELGTTYTNLDKNQSYYVVCQAGGRSGRACEFLEAQGFDVINVTGGMNEWQGEVAK